MSKFEGKTILKDLKDLRNTQRIDIGDLKGSQIITIRDQEHKKTEDINELPKLRFGEQRLYFEEVISASSDQQNIFRFLCLFLTFIYLFSFLCLFTIYFNQELQSLFSYVDVPMVQSAKMSNNSYARMLCVLTIGLFGYIILMLLFLRIFRIRKRN